MDDINIDIGLDPATYLAGADQLTGANSRLQQSMGGVVTTSAGVQKALSMITPSRAALAGMGALAMAAGKAQQEMSGLAATSAVTGINVGKLGGNMRQLARDLPIGNQMARQVTEQFTRMGVSSAGSEKQIGELAKTTANLGGATGENILQLGQGMTQLARATGNVNLEPKRFDKLSDSLVRVSKTSGASATDILAFSKNIAPMASAAGIGATGIIGISGAFARLGEDGIGASTAVNKMLTDMSRSAREGGPQMKAYAEIAGTTATEFERMFKANPAEALNKVTEALAKAGPAGPRQLEMIGLEGVRSQRALQAVSASGGLRGAIEEAEAGYGSGESQKAAEAAFAGLNDSFSELESTSEQLAQALGAPLTKPLKAFADGLKAPMEQVTKLVGNKYVQGAMTLAAFGAVAALGTKAILGPLGLAAIGRQMVKSGPVRSFMGGVSLGAEDEDEYGPGATRRSRYGANMIDRYDKGIIGQGPMGKTNERSMNVGVGVGQRLKQIRDETWADQAGRRQERRAQIGGDAEDAEWERGERRRQMNPIRRAADTVKTYSMVGLNTYIGEYARQMENAAEDDNLKRNPKLATPDEAREAGKAARAVYDQGGSLKDATKAFHDHLVTAGKDAGNFGDTLKGVRRSAAAALSLGGTLGDDAAAAGKAVAKKGAVMAGGALSSIGEMLGGKAGMASLGISAGLMAYQIGQAGVSQQKEQYDNYAKSDIYGRLNAYREASGRAGVAPVAVTAGTAMEAGEKTRTQTAEEARRVTAEDVRLAEGSKDKLVTKYYGSDKEVVAAIASTYSKGLEAADQAAVKMDLLRGGRTMENTQAILDALPASATTTTDIARPGANLEGIKAQTRGAQQGGNVPWASAFQYGLGQQDVSTRNNPLNKVLPDWAKTTPGGGLYVETMSEDALAANEQLAKSIQDVFLAQSETYKGSYAQQERLQSMNAALEEAVAAGDTEQVDVLSRAFQKNLMGEKYETKYLSAEDIQKEGFAKTFAKEDKGFGGSFQELMKTGSMVPGAGIKAEEKASYQSEILAKAGQTFAASLFDNTKAKRTTETEAIAASMGAPEDPKKLDRAVDAWVAAGTKSGMSLEQVGTSALKASTELNAAGQAFRIAKEAMAQADRDTALRNTSSDKTQGQIRGERYSTLMQRREALRNPQNDEQRQERINIENSIQEERDTYKASMIQRLEVQRSYQKQTFRATRDHHLQMEYAEVDYQKQVDRTIEGYNVNRERSIDAFNRQRERAEEDYATQRARTVRDFNIQMQHAEEDYLKARMRAQRDFAIQLARQIEDAAKTMYNPYDRIQTKATWDVKNLLVNMQEQNEAMTKQKDQLDQLRKMGLSAQAIDQLQLGKTENAQQVNNLVSDFTQDPAQVAELNRVAEERAKAAGSLYTDESNKDLNRAKEDLARGLGDMLTDYRTNMDRAREALSRNLGDMAKDFAKNLRRTNKDFNISLEQAAEDLSRNLGYMEDDFTTSVDRQNRAFQTAMDDMAQDIKDADLVVSGNMETLQEQTLAAMNGKYINFSKLLKNETALVAKDVKEKVIPDMVAALKDVGVTMADLKASPYSVNGAPTSGVGSYGGPSAQGRVGGQAEGGTIPGVSPHPKADNIPIMATAGEFMQPVRAVQHYGPEFMEAVRTLKLPKDVVNKYKEPTSTKEDDGPFFAEGGMIYQKMGSWLKKNIPDARITSSYRPGAITALGNVSMHGLGKALDINASMGNFNKILSTFGKSIHQLFYSPADGRTILKGEPWRMDRVTKAGHWDHVHWAMMNWTEQMANAGLGSAAGFGMAGGGLSLDWAKIFKRFKDKPWAYGLIANKVKNALMAKVGGLSGGSTEAYDGKAGVAQWSDEVADVLRMLGRGQGEAGAVLRRIEMESSGNPNAINNWDSNAKRGTPSKGLMQVIDPTFDSYRSRSLPDNIWNPKANIYAGSNYAIKRYGSLSAIDPRNKPEGYDKGGYMQPGEGQHVNRTGHPEPVLTQEQWASISRLAARGGISIDKEQGRGLGSGVSHISVTNHYTYDNRNDFSDAEITVMSNDPDEMGRKLAAKAVTSRVTQTRGVRRP